jgi:hypothetical protein
VSELVAPNNVYPYTRILTGDESLACTFVSAETILLPILYMYEIIAT